MLIINAVIKTLVVCKIDPLSVKRTVLSLIVQMQDKEYLTIWGKLAQGDHVSSFLKKFETVSIFLMCHPSDLSTATHRLVLQ